MTVIIKDPDADGEQRFVTLRMGALGRVLVVVLSPRESRTWLISACKVSKGEGEKYYA